MERDRVAVRTPKSQTCPGLLAWTSAQGVLPCYQIKQALWWGISASKESETWKNRVRTAGPNSGSRKEGHLWTAHISGWQGFKVPLGKMFTLCGSGGVESTAALLQRRKLPSWVPLIFPHEVRRALCIKGHHWCESEACSFITALTALLPMDVLQPHLPHPCPKHLGHFRAILSAPPWFWNLPQPSAPTSSCWCDGVIWGGEAGGLGSGLMDLPASTWGLDSARPSALGLLTASPAGACFRDHVWCQKWVTPDNWKKENCKSPKTSLTKNTGFDCQPPDPKPRWSLVKSSAVFGETTHFSADTLHCSSLMAQGQPHRRASSRPGQVSSLPCLAWKAQQISLGRFWVVSFSLRLVVTKPQTPFPPSFSSSRDNRILYYV